MPITRQAVAAPQNLHNTHNLSSIVRSTVGLASPARPAIKRFHSQAPFVLVVTSTYAHGPVRSCQRLHSRASTRRTLIRLTPQVNLEPW